MNKISFNKLNTLIFFWSEWCNPCKILFLILTNVILIIKKKKINFELQKFNVDNNQKLVYNLNIRIIPTLLFFKKKKLIDVKVGLFNEAIILNWIENLLIVQY